MTHVFIDTETTGLNHDFQEVWEIAYAVGDGPIQSGVVSHTTTFADPKALEMNRYYARSKTAREWTTEQEDAVREALTGNTLVAANPAFDAAFLRARWGATPWKYRLLDVEAYAMGALDLDEPKGLAYIAEQLGVAAPDHTAAADVHTLRECFKALRAIYRKAAAK